MRAGLVVLIGLASCSEPGGMLLSPGLNPGSPDASSVFPDASSPSVDAGDVVAGSVFDPEAMHRFEEPTVVFDPATNVGLMQGGRFRMVWTGERYIIIFERNFEGRVDLVTTSFDPQSSSPAEARVVAPRSNQQIGLGYDLLATDRGAVLVRGLGDDGLFFRRLNPLGESVGDGLILPPLPSLLSLIRWRTDELLVTAITTDPPRGYVISSDGEWRREFALFGAQRGFLSTTVAGRLNLLWADRRNPPEGTDTVYISEFDQMLRPVSTPREIYASENAIPVALGPPSNGRHAVIKDLDDGPLLLDTENGSPINLGPQDGFNGAFSVFDTQGRLFVVRERGRAPNGPATSLEIFAMDLNDGRRSEVTKLFDLTEDTYIEHVQVVARGEIVGVGIATGSASQRRLRFIEVSAVVPTD